MVYESEFDYVAYVQTELQGLFNIGVAFFEEKCFYCSAKPG